MNASPSLISPWHAEVVADTIGQHDRIITCVACIPNAIHQEMLRHRSFSFSVESQRAVPASEYRQRLIKDGPYLPPFLARSPSMQGKKGLVPVIQQAVAKSAWLISFQHVCQLHYTLEDIIHKSIINRVLAPFAWTRMVITGSESAWNHFFTLRCSPQADVAIQAVAAQLLRAIKKSQPQHHDCHLPFVNHHDFPKKEGLLGSLISAARCASISYGGVREKTLDQSIQMATELIKNRHWSPFEHQAFCEPSDIPWPGNLHSREWVSARTQLESPHARLAIRQQLESLSDELVARWDDANRSGDVNPDYAIEDYESVHAILPGNVRLMLKDGQLVEA